MADKSKKELYCSFCGKSQYEVKKLIAGPNCFICDECVELCMQIIIEESCETGSSYRKFVDFFKKQPSSLEKFNAFFGTKSPADKTEEITKKIVAKCDDIIAMLDNMNKKIGG